MRWQTSLVLAVLLLAVGGFYYVYEIRGGPEREKAETRKGRVLTAESQDVTQFPPWNTCPDAKRGQYVLSCRWLEVDHHVSPCRSQTCHPPARQP